MEKIDFVYSMVVKNSELDVVLKKDIFIDGDVEMMESKIRKLSEGKGLKVFLI